MGVLFNHKKHRTSKHYAKWKTQATKDYIVYNSIYMNFFEKKKGKSTEAESKLVTA